MGKWLTVVWVPINGGRTRGDGVGWGKPIIVQYVRLQYIFIRALHILDISSSWGRKWHLRQNFISEVKGIDFPDQNHEITIFPRSKSRDHESLVSWTSAPAKCRSRDHSISLEHDHRIMASYSDHLTMSTTLGIFNSSNNGSNRQPTTSPPPVYEQTSLGDGKVGWSCWLS